MDGSNQSNFNCNSSVGPVGPDTSRTRSVSHYTKPDQIGHRTHALEKELLICKEALKKSQFEVKLLAAQIQIMDNFVSTQFGVGLINRQSDLYKIISQRTATEDIRRILKDLSSEGTSETREPQSPRTTRRGAVDPKKLSEKATGYKFHIYHPKSSSTSNATNVATGQVNTSPSTAAVPLPRSHSRTFGGTGFAVLVHEPPVPVSSDSNDTHQHLCNNERISEPQNQNCPSLLNTNELGSIESFEDEIRELQREFGIETPQSFPESNPAQKTPRPRRITTRTSKSNNNNTEILKILESQNHGPVMDALRSKLKVAHPPPAPKTTSYSCLRCGLANFKTMEDISHHIQHNHENQSPDK